MLMGRPAAKMMAAVAMMAQKVLTKPNCSSSVAPSASSTRKLAAPPSAVCATRHSLHLRKDLGVKRSA